MVVSFCHMLPPEKPFPGHDKVIMPETLYHIWNKTWRLVPGSAVDGELGASWSYLGPVLNSSHCAIIIYTLYRAILLLQARTIGTGTISGTGKIVSSVSMVKTNGLQAQTSAARKLFA
jgi:hypothetical protein